MKSSSRLGVVTSTRIRREMRRSLLLHTPSNTLLVTASSLLVYLV
jgi:hypothetical protein